MNTSFSLVSQDSMSFFEYLEGQDENININGPEINIQNNSEEIIREANFSQEQRQRALLYKKLKSKCICSLVRTGIILFIYIIQVEPLTQFLSSIISFLLIHEVSTIVNFFIIFSQRSISRMFNSNSFNNSSFKFCNIVNTLNNFVLFIWFLYGNFMILTDKIGLEESLSSKLFTKLRK